MITYGAGTFFCLSVTHERLSIFVPKSGFCSKRAYEGEKLGDSLIRGFTNWTVLDLRRLIGVFRGPRSTDRSMRDLGFRHRESAGGVQTYGRRKVDSREDSPLRMNVTIIRKV